MASEEQMSKLPLKAYLLVDRPLEGVQDVSSRIERHS